MLSVATSARDEKTLPYPVRGLRFVQLNGTLEIKSCHSFAHSFIKRITVAECPNPVSAAGYNGESLIR